MKNQIFILVLILMFTACQSNNNEPTPNTPTIISLSSKSVHYNDVLTITGTNFDPIITNNIVTINGVIASISVASATSLTIKVPAVGTNNASLVVKTTKGSSSESILTYIADVFIAGYESSSQKSFAKYWKNGNSITLSKGADRAGAMSIFVKGDDVYVAGYEENNDGKTVAKYWKNGVETSLTNGNQDAIAKSIYINENDIYVALSEYNGREWVAKYWKNGTLISLTDGLKSADANGIYAYKGDVYVSGYEHNGKFWVAKYWKNGNSISLTDGTSDARAKSIYGIGNDIYIAGSQSTGNRTIASYWKNGTAIKLTNGTSDAYATSIFVNNNNVYVAGLEFNGRIWQAKYWKNGTLAESLKDDTWGYDDICISVNGDDVHLGLTRPSAMYWNNGTIVPLNINNSSQYSGVNYIYLR